VQTQITLATGTAAVWRARLSHRGSRALCQRCHSKPICVTRCPRALDVVPWMAFFGVLATESSLVQVYRADSRISTRLCRLVIVYSSKTPAFRHEVKLRLFDAGVNIAAEALDDRTGGLTNEAPGPNQLFVLLRQDAPVPNCWRVARNLIVTPSPILQAYCPRTRRTKVQLENLLSYQCDDRRITPDQESCSR
jgi:hypothetical protein